MKHHKFIGKRKNEAGKKFMKNFFLLFFVGEIANNYFIHSKFLIVNIFLIERKA